MLNRILLSILALSGLALCIGGLSVEGDRLTVVNEELGLVTGRLGSAVSSEARAASLKHVHDCASDFRRAATAFAFADLQMAHGSNSEGGLAEQAAGAVEQQLRCSPGDGNAWLLLAIATNAAGQRERSLAYTRISQRYSPREAWIIEGRINLICSMADLNVDDVSQIVRDDFGVLLRGRLFTKAANIYDRCGNEAARELFATISETDPDIREAFSREVARKLVR